MPTLPFCKIENTSTVPVDSIKLNLLFAALFPRYHWGVPPCSKVRLALYPVGASNRTWLWAAAELRNLARMLEEAKTSSLYVGVVPTPTLPLLVLEMSVPFVHWPRVSCEQPNKTITASITNVLMRSMG